LQNDAILTHRVIKSFNTECYEIYDQVIDQINQSISTTSTVNKGLFIGAEELAKNWGIGQTAAENTIKSTAQCFIHRAIHPIERRFKTKNTTLRYNHLKCRFKSDTFFSSKKSILNNTCTQLFISEFDYGKFCPR
jgi:hypothetical protein